MSIETHTKYSGSNKYSDTFLVNDSDINGVSTNPVDRVIYIFSRLIAKKKVRAIYTTT